MALSLVSDTTNVLPFPGDRTERATMELVALLAPPRSLVDTLVAERGLRPHDAQAGTARTLSYQASTLEAGFGREETIARLRVLVDAHVAHAARICRAYREAGERLMGMEFEAAHAARMGPHMHLRLARARDRVRGRAIAARAAADMALGAVTALSTYGPESESGLPAGDADPRQLSLFGAAAVG
jgi:hypothetical protein